MNREDLINTVKEDLEKYGAKKVSIFGSYARNEERDNSDLDIIVEFSSIKTLFEIASIERNISEKTGVKIDLLTKKSVSPYIMANIKNEIKELL